MWASTSSTTPGRPTAPTSCRRSSAPAPPSSTSTATAFSTSSSCKTAAPRRAKNRLYRQTPEHHFQDVSAGSGLDFAGWNMGVAVGDVNNDGRPDVLITQYGGAKLFLNLGGGKFKDVTKEAGLDAPGWCTSAAFFDYDRDGCLDLVIARYVDYDRTWPCGGASGKPDYCTPRCSRARSPCSSATSAPKPTAASASRT